MKQRFAALATGLLLAAVPSPLNAADWARNVQGWDVGRSDDICIMTQEFEGAGATVLTISGYAEPERRFISVANYDWTAKEDDTYQIEYHLGGWTYTFPSLGISASARKGFMSKTRNDFLQDFGKESGMTITLDGVLVDDLNLKGTGAALVVFRSCLAELAREQAKEERDRKRLEHIPADPFAQRDAAKKQ